MKHLIEIQKLINEIEDVTLDKKYHSKFNYKDWGTLEIETFCSQQTITYKMLFDRMLETATYLIANDKLEILDLDDRIEPKTYVEKIKIGEQ